MQWIDNGDYVYPDNNPGFKIFDENETSKPALWIDQTINPIGDRESSLNIKRHSCSSMKDLSFRIGANVVSFNPNK